MLIALGYFWRATDVAALNDELGAVEIASGLAYLSAVAAAVVTAMKTTGLQRWIFIGWAALCVVFFGEETSWLQHYLGFSTPEAIERINVQGEFNLHNITTDGGSVTDAIAEGGLNWAVFIRSQNLFNAGFLFCFLAIPLAHWASTTVRRLVHAWSVPTVGLRFVACFWTPIVLSVAVGFSDPDNLTSLRAHVGETRELIYALAISTFLALHARAIPPSHMPRSKR